MVVDQPPQMPALDTSKLYVWVKGVESKVNNLLREIDVLKNDFIKKNNDIKREIKTLNDDLMEIKHEWEKTNQKMDLIIKELKQTAGKEEVMVLKKYLDLWNPLHFATQRDVEQLIDDRLSSRSARPHSLEEKPSATPAPSSGTYPSPPSEPHHPHHQTHHQTHHPTHHPAHKKAKTKHK